MRKVEWGRANCFRKIRGGGVPVLAVRVEGGTKANLTGRGGGKGRGRVVCLPIEGKEEVFRRKGRTGRPTGGPPPTASFTIYTGRAKVDGYGCVWSG